MSKAKSKCRVKTIATSVLGLALLSGAQVEAAVKLGKTVSGADVWDMPTQVTFHIFDARDAQEPIVSQSFQQGEWSSTGEPGEGGSLRISAEVTALDDDSTDTSLWFDTELDGVLVGDREAVVRVVPVGSISAAGGFVLPDDGYVINSQADLDAGGGVSWTEVTDKPPGFADDVDDIGDVWSEITGMPDGFADGVDNQGVTTEVDPQVGTNAVNKVPRWVVPLLGKGGALVEGTIYDNGSRIGIGTTSLTGLLNLGTAPKEGGIGGTDCTLGGGGYLVSGDTAATNLCLDSNELMVRNNGNTSSLYLQNDGGVTRTGGNLNIYEPGFGALQISLTQDDTGGVAKIYSAAGDKNTILMEGDHTTDRGGSIQLYESGTGLGSVRMRASEFGNDGGAVHLYNKAGTTTIELDAEVGVGGKGTIYTQVLNITGGADFSEQFSIDRKEYQIKPGMVVSIDPANPGKLQISTEPYDSKVAGIISGAGGVETGLMMGQKGTLADGEHPVALTGRVYTWVDASRGAVEPGDMLTSSSTPGYAMKVTEHGKSAGAVIGKAMTPLAKGEEGLVLVLVSLQ